LLKKTITYENFNEETVSEDFFFHLSKAELIELEMSHDGGLSASLQRIVELEDKKAVIAEFKNIILSSYGKKSEDGRRFIKNQALREEFESSEAYSTLFMELVTDTDAAVEFINGIIPKGMVEEAERVAQAPVLTAIADNAENPEKKTVTRKELTEMSTEDFAIIQEKLHIGEVTLVE
jgi:hypothetical protein